MPLSSLEMTVTAARTVPDCRRGRLRKYLHCRRCCLPLPIAAACYLLQVEFTDADADARQEFESAREEVRR